MWLLDLLAWGGIAFLFYIATGSGRIALIETIVFRLTTAVVFFILILFFTGHFVRAILLTIAVVVGYLVYRYVEDQRLKKLDEEANAGNEWMKNL
jgi:chromate transport protein ChrA